LGIIWLVKITGIIWLRSIVDKLALKHEVDPSEVEEVFVARPQYRRLEKGRIEGEDIYAAYGRTAAGRYITVVFIRNGGGESAHH
jgi:hypothetical protein